MGREFHVDGDFDGGSEPERRETPLFNAQEAEIASIIRDILGVDVTSRDDRFAEELNADSLDFVEIVMALEEHFGIEIKDDEAQDIERVGEVFDLIAAKKA